MRKRLPILVLLFLLVTAVLILVNQVRNQNPKRLFLVPDSGHPETFSESERGDRSADVLKKNEAQILSPSPPGEKSTAPGLPSATQQEERIDAVMGRQLGGTEREFAFVYRSRVVGDGTVDEVTEGQFRSALRTVCERRGVTAVIDAGVETTSLVPFVVYHKPQFDITDEVRREYQSIRSAERAASK